MLNKSIDFLMENAGPVIQYRLQKEILRNLAQTEEENLLEQIYQLPNFKLVESYVKPNGYIGSGAHSWGKWRGVTLHETYLQDGEASARCLSNYAIPKQHPMIVNFISAMRGDNSVSVKIGSKYYGPGWAFARPFSPFTSECINTVMYRRPLTELAMLGIGESVGVIKESVANVRAAMDADGILRTKYKKSSFPTYPTAYVDIVLEADHKRKWALECDLTFWAVQFLTLVDDETHVKCDGYL